MRIFAYVGWWSRSMSQVGWTVSEKSRPISQDITLQENCLLETEYSVATSTKSVSDRYGDWISDQK